MTAIAPLVGCVLLVAALAACVGAVASKSLFVLTIRLGAGASLSAAALVALGAGDAALLVAVVFAVACPLVLLAVTLLSARSVKGSPNRFSWWLSGAVAGLLAAILLSALPEVTLSVSRAATPAPLLSLGLLVVVAAAGCAALLGHGERGVFDPRAEWNGDDQR